MSQYLLASSPQHPSSSPASAPAPGLWLCSGPGCSDLLPEASSLSQGPIRALLVHIGKQAVPRMAPRVPHPSPAGVCAGAVLSDPGGLSYLWPLAAADLKLTPQ